jgi:hypothetical protein
MYQVMEDAGSYCGDMHFVTRGVGGVMLGTFSASF